MYTVSSFCSLGADNKCYVQLNQYILKRTILIFITVIFYALRLQSQSLLPVGNGIPTNYGIHGGTVTYNNEIYAADNAHIYKWNGSNWLNLGVTVDDAILCMTVYNNELYIGGWFEHFNGNPVNRIIKYNGTNWQSVGTGILVADNVDGGVEKMITYNGKLIAIGGFIQAGNISANHIASWDGIAWGTLGSGLTGLSSIPSMCVFNNELFIFSKITNAGGIPVNHAAKWNGTSWSALGTGINHWPVSSTVFDNSIYVGLWISEGDTSSMVVKWDGINWSNIEQNLADTSWNIVMDLMEFNGCLYATGLINTINGVATSNIARYDGTLWYSVENGINGMGNFFTSLNNELYLTGDFTNSGLTTVNNVVKFSLPPICATPVDELISDNVLFNIYPNPTTDFLYITKNNVSSLNYNLRIIDLLGRTVMNSKTIPDKINLEDLENGYYIIQFENDGKQEIKRFIKK
jgi:hypothetical protein